MAFPRLAVSRNPTSPSPERAALAAAIETWRTARDDVTTIERAIYAAIDTCTVAANARDTAAAAVTAARADAVVHLTQTALGTASTPPTTLKATRAALAEADDALEDAQAALDGLKARLNPAKDTLAFAAQTRDEAVLRVLRGSSEITALIADVQRLQRELADRGTALTFLARHRAIDLSRVVDGYRNEQPPAEIAIYRLNAPVHTWNDLLANVPGPTPWQVAIEGLKVDATTPLPSSAT
jgi:predicted RNase H-like nuclease (RuvC/YqgF family)